MSSAASASLLVTMLLSALPRAVSMAVSYLLSVLIRSPKTPTMSLFTDLSLSAASKRRFTDS